MNIAGYTNRMAEFYRSAVGLLNVRLTSQRIPAAEQQRLQNGRTNVEYIVCPHEGAGQDGEPRLNINELLAELYLCAMRGETAPKLVTTIVTNGGKVSEITQLVEVPSDMLSSDMR